MYFPGWWPLRTVQDAWASYPLYRPTHETDTMVLSSAGPITLLSFSIHRIQFYSSTVLPSGLGKPTRRFFAYIKGAQTTIYVGHKSALGQSGKGFEAGRLGTFKLHSRYDSVVEGDPWQSQLPARCSMRGMYTYVRPQAPGVLTTLHMHTQDGPISKLYIFSTQPINSMTH